MAAGQWDYLRWAFLGRPKSDRQLYRLVKRHNVRRVVELGMGSIERATRLIQVCQRYACDEPVTYAGLDWFEERSKDAESLKLIDAHRQLKATGAEVRLMPGGPVAGLPSVANALAGTGLLLVSPEADDAALEAAWFYLPRMLGPNAQVLRGIADAAENGDQRVAWSPLTMADIECRAQRAAPARAA